MIRPVLVEILSQAIADGEKDEMELALRGSYETDGNSRTISYTEIMGGGETCPVTVTVSGGTAGIKRSGDFSFDVRLERGKRYASLYGTPYGNSLMTFLCREIKDGLTDGGGELELSYLIELDGKTISENKVRFTVTPAGGDEKDDTDE